MGLSPRRRRFHALSFVGALTCALLAARPAFADGQSDAKDLFQRGRDLRARGNCNEAVPLFRKAHAVYPQALGSIRNIAECEEQLGHFASSRRAWLDIQRALLTMPHDPKYEGWDKDAEDAAERLRPKVATVVAEVVVRSPDGEGPATEKTGVELLVNGESLGTALVGTPLERDPGTYTIRAQAKYAEPVETTVALVAGDQKHVTLRLVQNPPEAPGVIHFQDEHNGRRIAGWATLGVGAAALVGAGVTYLLRQGAKSDLEGACPEYERGVCPLSKQGEIEDITSRGSTMDTLSWVLMPVGVVGVAAGIVLILTSPASAAPTASGGLATPSAETARNQTRFAIDAGLGRASATWRF